MSDIEELTATIREFARERDWERFHTPKNLAMDPPSFTTNARSAGR